MYACREGAITAVQLLLQFNANTIVKDKKGQYTNKIFLELLISIGTVQLKMDYLS